MIFGHALNEICTQALTVLGVILMIFGTVTTLARMRAGQ